MDPTFWRNIWVCKTLFYMQTHIFLLKGRSVLNKIFAYIKFHFSVEIWKTFCMYCTYRWKFKQNTLFKNTFCSVWTVLFWWLCQFSYKKLLCKLTYSSETIGPYGTLTFVSLVYNLEWNFQKSFVRTYKW